jgi:hypothetical protein
MLHGPLVLRLPRAALARKDVVRRMLDERELTHAFALKNDELDFARALLGARSNLWLWRVDQRAFGGDFVVVDVSSPSLARRPVLALDLKWGQRVRADRPGIQMKNVSHVVARLVEQRVVAEGSIARCLTGDGRSMLEVI